MAKITLSYFDFDGGRGEDSRLALFIAGVDFVDHRVRSADWLTLKAATPFGGLPVLEIEGKGKLGESNVILTYIGRAYDLHPKDLWEAARHEAIMIAVEELRSATSVTMGIKDEEAKKRAREELASGLMQRWGANIEAQLGDGPFVGGATLNVVDLKLFVALRFYTGGGVDYISGDVFAAFPKLTGLLLAVKDHPKVVAYYAARRAAS